MREFIRMATILMEINRFTCAWGRVGATSPTHIQCSLTNARWYKLLVPSDCAHAIGSEGRGVEGPRREVQRHRQPCGGLALRGKSQRGVENFARHREGIWYDRYKTEGET